MEIKDIKETKNHVLDRREITAKIYSEIAPSTKDVLSLLAKKLSIQEDAIKIKGIYGKFGIKEFELKANVYKSGQYK
jgi:ribosomal protein S24E